MSLVSMGPILVSLVALASMVYSMMRLWRIIIGKSLCPPREILVKCGDESDWYFCFLLFTSH